MKLKSMSNSIDITNNIGQFTLYANQEPLDVAWSVWSIGLVLSAMLMVLYECWWIRYFMGEKMLKNFYSSFCGVPVAGATLPVVAFFLLGVYGKVIWLMGLVVILGIGHIGIHLQHLNGITE